MFARGACEGLSLFAFISKPQNNQQFQNFSVSKQFKNLKGNIAKDIRNHCRLIQIAVAVFRGTRCCPER